MVAPAAAVPVAAAPVAAAAGVAPRCCDSFLALEVTVACQSGAVVILSAQVRVGCLRLISMHSRDMHTACP